ncbi:MAG: aminotransferase class I/II-fold pyridoxal phosphate-dependent enzyme [Thermoguttaceae bacterium]
MTVGSQAQEARFGLIAEAVFAQVRRGIPSDVDCELALDSRLDEIGLDSLARMAVLNRLEEAFGLRFSEEALYDMGTCRDMIEYVDANASCGNSPWKPAAAAPVPSPPTASRSETIPVEHYDVARFPECIAMGERLAGMAAAGLENPFFRVKDGVGKATVTIAGREVVSYTSFDYLGMAHAPEVIAAAKQAIDGLGTSASASRLVGGNHAILPQLDAEIACFLGTEAAVVFPSGYGTNASALGHLFGEEDLILYDELAHNSIVQGTLLSKAQRRPFPHNDFEFLDKLLRDVRGDYRRVVVAIEGAYSMDGDYPNLPRFVEVKKRHAALLYVDEAHSLGVLGATGRGICEHYGVDPADGDLWMGTISKALGSSGGYLAGRAPLIQYLKYTTPAFVFATALSPANAAAALAAVRLLRAEPQRVARLRDRARLFLSLANDCGLNTGNSGDTPVIPIILGDSLRCVHVASALLRQGVDVQPILYPAVPESLSRLRFFITAEHSEEQICQTVQLLADCLAAPRQG